MSERTHWKGSKLLTEWRGERSQQDAADLIGIDLARYNAFEKERARPGLDWAVKIEDVTAGSVPAKSWTVTEKRKARAA